jgi:hypothetical protein
VGSGAEDTETPTAINGRRRKIFRWGIVFLVIGVLLPPLTVTSLLWFASMGTPDRQALSRGRDAVWLGHAWVDGQRGPADVEALADRLSGGGIRDLFVHSGPFDNDGSLDAALHPRAEWALHAIRAAMPGVRVQAWLGQRVDPGRLDLADPQVRARVLDGARRMLDAGFDGIHYNFEPVPDGHAGLLDLLDRTRVLTRSRSAVVSMSAHHVEPLPGMSRIDDPIIGHTKWWSPRYLSEVASRVDQIAIMSYDTALPSQSLYAGYVRRQTEVALAAVPVDTHLLMGLPAYHTNSIAHRAYAETVAAALRGVRLALGSNPRQGFGVAIYVDFAATEADWNSYRTDWVRAGDR